MFTEKSLLKAKINLYNITTNHAMQDYLQANYKNGKRKSKKHIPYSLSTDTQRANELQYIIFCNDIIDITTEQEEEIKGFLLIYKLTRTEFLKEAGGTNYYKNSIKELGL